MAQDAVLGAYETKIMGRDSVRNGIFVATNKRLVFFAKKLTGFDLEIFPYKNISSIEMRQEPNGAPHQLLRLWQQGLNEMDFGGQRSKVR